MKKRLMTGILVIVLLFIALQITTLATDVIRPKNNVATTTTHISVFRSGQAIVGVRYEGYVGITSGAEITLKIEKKNGILWQDVISQTYHTKETHHVNKLEYPLPEMGAYRFTVIYTVSGSAGKEDVVKIQEEKTYDEACPMLPPLLSGKHEEHDCTARHCCDACYRIIGLTSMPAHQSDGVYRVYDDEFHYSFCGNRTVSYANCTHILKEKHRFDENDVCRICGYRRVRFTETADAENGLVSVTVYADGTILSFLPTEYLEDYAYEEWNEEGRYGISHLAREGSYTVHIPFEDYKEYQNEGLRFWIYSQQKRFSVRIHPTLDIDSYQKGAQP
ncbi:MAG: hypothetical protein IJV98_04205 [Clostridia bacterium]|nr:hypothetical protein [Clostridia bacterium]